LAIVVTTSVLGDIVSSVVGNEAQVEVLIPVGADAHDYQFSATQVATMETADIIFVNGLGLEESLEDVLDGLEGDGANVFEIAPAVDPIPFGEDGGLDPHAWMDPLRMAEASLLIADELGKLDPDVGWMARAEEYAATLRALDDEIIDLLGDVPESNRRLVTNHDAFGYFADRYEFDLLGTVIPGGSTLAAPSSADLAALVDVMKSEEVTVIFAETSSSTTLAEAVTAELGSDVDVVELYTESLGEVGSDADTYIGMLRVNATRIADHLS
jgi:zinc/manganese transport system substrate-binding protein